jgi:hypothetical protein
VECVAYESRFDCIQCDVTMDANQVGVIDDPASGAVRVEEVCLPSVSAVVGA